MEQASIHPSRSFGLCVVLVLRGGFVEVCFKEGNMGAIVLGNTIIHGNFSEVLPEKPENFDYDNDAKWLEDYPEKWERIKIGKTTCTCEKIETWYQPWYGFTWYHTKQCAIVQRVEKQPGLLNLPAFDGYEVIGYSD